MLTEHGYCYATKNKAKVRVAQSCCGVTSNAPTKLPHGTTVADCQTQASRRFTIIKNGGDLDGYFASFDVHKDGLQKYTCKRFHGGYLCDEAGHFSEGENYYEAMLRRGASHSALIDFSLRAKGREPGDDALFQMSCDRSARGF